MPAIAINNFRASGHSSGAAGGSNQPQPQAANGTLCTCASGMCCPNPQAASTGSVPTCPVAGYPGLTSPQWIVLPVTGSASGAPPLHLNYTVPLTSLPKNGIITMVRAQYGITTPGATVTDPYGARSGAGYIDWSAGGAKALNAFYNSGSPATNFPVTAIATFGFPGGTLTLASFEVYWVPATLA